MCLRSQANKGLYQKWVKSQHKRVAAAGSLEEEGGSANRQALANRFHPSMRHKSWKTKGPAPAAGAPRNGELRSRTAVVKEREKKERRKEWLQEKQAAKGKAGGKGGGKPGGGKGGPRGVSGGGVSKGGGRGGPKGGKGRR